MVPVLLAFWGLAHWASLGQFEDHGDIGTVLHPGAAVFDSAQGSFTITGGGENMWGTADAFHFVWKKYSGDVSITADIRFPTTTGNPHKKAVLMIRQSLDADSAYVDAALHVEGLTSLQSREAKGAATHEVGIAAASPTRLRLEKRGEEFYLYLARTGEKLRLGGGSMRLKLMEPFYIGLGVCAHDKDALETAVFSNVSIEAPAKGKTKLYSTLETISVSSTDQRVVAVFDERIESLRWTPDGNWLLIKRGKEINRVSASTGEIESLPKAKTSCYWCEDSGANPPPAAPAIGINLPGMHTKTKPAASPDGLHVATLSYEGGKPRETTLSMETLSDGKVKVLAKLMGGQGTLGLMPWSPDSKRLAFVSYQLVP